MEKKRLSLVLLLHIVFYVGCQKKKSDIDSITDILSLSNGHARIEIEINEYKNVNELKLSNYSTEKEFNINIYPENLKKLEFFDCKLNKGINVGLFKELFALIVQQTEINQIHEINKLKNLEYLILQGTFADSIHLINYLPDSINSLEVSYNYHLIKLKIDAGSKFKRLQFLNLNYNFYLKEIDTSFFECRNLNCISISGCNNFVFDKILYYPNNINTIIISNDMFCSKLDSICVLKNIELKIEK